jgi:hypothetical protein
MFLDIVETLIKGWYVYLQNVWLLSDLIYCYNHEELFFALLIFFLSSYRLIRISTGDQFITAVTQCIQLFCHVMTLKGLIYSVYENLACSH